MKLLNFLFLLVFIPALVVADPNKPSAAFAATSAADITGTTSTAVKTAAGAGIRHYIQTITISNMHASVDTRVDVLDGTTVIWQCPAAHGGGGCALHFPTPLRGSANTAINCQAATTGAAVRCSVAGYTSSF